MKSKYFIRAEERSNPETKKRVKDVLDRFEQASLDLSLEQANLIKSGILKGLSFDEIWDELAK